MKKTLSAAILGAACLLTACQSAGAGDEVLTVSTQDPFTPGTEMMFSSNCDKDRAQLETSFGESTIMSPAADAPYLIGYITVPSTLGPGPDGGKHTYTVTCGDDSATFRFDDAAETSK